MGARAARALQGHRRKIPAVPLRALDPRAMAGIPRALRVRADARLAARAARLRGRDVLAPGRVSRGRIPEDAAPDAPRLGQLHARSGRVGCEAARGLGAVAHAGAAARRRRDLPRRPYRNAGAPAPRPAAQRRSHPVPRRESRLHADRRAHALAPRTGRRRQTGRAAGARAAAPAHAPRVAVRTRRRSRRRRVRRATCPKARCASSSACRR